LPLEVELRGLPSSVQFSRRGVLVTPVEFAIELRGESSRWSVGPGGVLSKTRKSKP